MGAMNGARLIDGLDFRLEIEGSVSYVITCISTGVWYRSRRLGGVEEYLLPVFYPVTIIGAV